MPENFVVKQNILINCDTEYGDELPDLSGVIVDGNISFEEGFKLSHWKWKPKNSQALQRKHKGIDLITTARLAFCK